MCMQSSVIHRKSATLQRLHAEGHWRHTWTYLQKLRNFLAQQFAPVNRAFAQAARSVTVYIRPSCSLNVTRGTLSLSMSSNGCSGPVRRECP